MISTGDAKTFDCFGTAGVSRNAFEKLELIFDYLLLTVSSVLEISLLLSKVGNLITNSLHSRFGSSLDVVEFVPLAGGPFIFCNHVGVC